MPGCGAVLIVGGGPAGLATAAALTRRGIPYRLLERGLEPGHMWASMYDSLTLHTGRHMSTLPGMAFPRGTPLFPTGDHFRAYLAAYARRFGIVMETGSDVTGIAREDEQWVANTVGGATVRSRVLVMATGIMSNPRRPVFPCEERFAGVIAHSVAYRRPSELAGKRVLVVGVGNSGGEIAAELGNAGIDVTVAVRSGANVVPREIAGVPIQYIAHGLRLLPAALRERIAVVVQHLAEAKHGAPVIPRGRLSALESVPLIGFLLVDTIRSGRVRLKLAAIAEFTERGVRFTDGAEAEFEAVILATGFSPALGPLGALVRKDSKGFAIRTDRVASADQPRLYFVGSNYDATGGLANIRRDAMLVAARIAGRG
ncbi:MAG: putative oxidoreductase CzcO [Gemmatimonadaceae bacterium]|nr:putative oxidoreductase CzcO [Gemmatimonadaceae bacterium]